MQIYNYAEARQHFATMFDLALSEEIIITRKNGNRFKLVSLSDDSRQSAKSPLDVEGIDAQVTMPEIMAVIREGRE
ncbi:hypothetical protein FACS1894139_01180 [Planctomycetales bacterium]|nr:hypothetical protein FACS1894107_04070 [Planctomycetales bacterium]GHT02634.1 hypothetical protein FACS1894139_01180 [Planctomycetales bacterium]